LDFAQNGAFQSTFWGLLDCFFPKTDFTNQVVLHFLDWKLSKTASSNQFLSNVLIAFWRKCLLPINRFYFS
jgi:hypothetical protein